MKKPTDDGPILNGACDEPAFHYSTDAAGNLNDSGMRPGRRVLATDVPPDSLSPSRARGDVRSQWQGHA